MKAILDKIGSEKYIEILLTEEEARRLVDRKLIFCHATLSKIKYNIGARQFTPSELMRELNAID